MKYKRVDTKNGRTMYFVNGKMTSVDNVPQPVLSALGPNQEFEAEDTTEQIAPIHIQLCVVCNGKAAHVKFLSGENFGLCAEHYTLSTGKVAQALREKLNRGEA